MDDDWFEDESGSTLFGDDLRGLPLLADVVADEFDTYDQQEAYEGETYCSTDVVVYHPGILGCDIFPNESRKRCQLRIL